MKQSPFASLFAVQRASHLRDVLVDPGLSLSLRVIQAVDGDADDLVTGRTHPFPCVKDYLTVLAGAVEAPAVIMLFAVAKLVIEGVATTVTVT